MFSLRTALSLTLLLAASIQAQSPEGTIARLPPVLPAPPAAQPAVYISGAAGSASLDQRVAELEKDLKELHDAAKKKQDADARKPTSRFTMQLQADSLHFAQDDANMATVGDIPDAAVFRRARVGWLGEYMLTEYRIEFDFALSGRPSFMDVWVGWKDVPLLGRVKVGHYFEPFSLERYTPNRFMTFMERSLIDQAFAPARNLGVMASDYSASRNATWALGVFRTNSDVFGDDQGDQGEKSVTGRVTWLPWYDEPAEGRYLLHLGAGYSFRDADDNIVRLRAQPEIRSNNTTPPTPFFVDTGMLPAYHHQLFGLEAALVRGPFSLQWEYMYVPVDRISGADPTFQGTYLYASYFLTGEHRPYRREFGVFDRVRPFEEFFLTRTRRGVCAGWGAWELAARISHVDLTDADVQGGVLNELTFGVNWYMNPYTRLTANYVHAFLDRAPLGNSNCDMFGLRAGFEF